MSSEELRGNVSNGIDQLESAATSALDDASARAKGEARAFTGKVDRAVGKAKQTVKTTARKAQATASRAADRASDTYQLLRDDAERLAKTVDPMVKEQPYVAMVAGLVIGLVAGAVLFGGGAKVIYIKPARQ
jgi:ElaB/YqjD/DUF883 family membrane-anchored ribosome-binding protein